MDNAESETVRMQAAGMLLDRAYGKTREHVDASVNMRREEKYRTVEEVSSDLRDMGVDVVRIMDILALDGGDRPVDYSSEGATLIEHDPNETGKGSGHQS